MSETPEKKNTLSSKKQLKFLYLNISDHSNLGCFHCYDPSFQSQAQSNELSLGAIENLVDDCKKLELETVCITDADPFFNQTWLEIGRLFRSRGIKIAVSVNKATITEHIALNLKELDALTQINLDETEDLMDFRGGVDYSSCKAPTGVALLVKHGIPVNLNAVISKKNIHMVDAFSSFSAKLEIDIKFTLYNGIFNNGAGQMQSLSIEETAQFIKKAGELYDTNPRISTSLPPLLVPANMKPTVNPGCGWTHHVGAVLSNGDVTICPFASGCPELIAGNIRDQSFDTIWTHSPLLKNLRNNSYTDLKGICMHCPVSDLCVGACRLDSYLRLKDPTAGFHLCQSFYEAMLKGLIPDKEFPSMMLEVIV